MDQFPLISACFLLCYLIGSIPTAVWIGMIFYRTDVRTQGSGNAGATNTFRVLGKAAGISVLLIDTLKGFCAASLAYWLNNNGIIAEENILFLKMLLGLTAVLGHIFPLFAGFRGGKGVATLLGMVICVSPVVAAICVLSFLTLFFLFHYVSVGSMIGGIIFSVLIFNNVAGEANTPARLLAVFMTLMLIYTHRTNIQKLRSGTENKMYFSKRVKSEELKVKS